MAIRKTLSKLFKEFFESERASGAILLFCTLGAVVLANSPIGNEYLNFWHLKVGIDLPSFKFNQTVQHWINDGLMAIFFLLIGLEIERELFIGELADFKKAMLPIFAAIGGMLVPALLYLLVTAGSQTRAGFGIPMATDIAFAIAALSILGSGAPISLKIFLTALAIIDDLGAMFTIALFYSSTFSAVYLFLAALIFVGLILLNRRGVKSLPYYLILGLVMWYFVLQSGIHASIAGILLAFAIPFEKGDHSSPSSKLQHQLHKPVGFIIMPLFALANTGIIFWDASFSSIFTSNTLGIFTGLVFGKPLGIVLFSALAVKLRLSKLPRGLDFNHILGAGFLAGIGFTMSIFITFLAFGNTAIAQASKISIFLASVAAASAGLIILRRTSKPDINSDRLA